MLSLFEYCHKFTVEEVIAQHEIRRDEPVPELNPATSLKTYESEQQKFIAYNEFEFDDFGLSCLLVESLLTPTLT